MCFIDVYFSNFNIVHEVLLFQTEEVVGGHFKI